MVIRDLDIKIFNLIEMNKSNTEYLFQFEDHKNNTAIIKYNILRHSSGYTGNHRENFIDLLSPVHTNSNGMFGEKV